MEGFNIAFKVGAKTMVGRTQDSLSISAIIKKSITKDTKGSGKSRVIGHDVSLKAAGIVEITSPSAPSVLNRDDILALVLKTGDSAEVEATYVCDGGKTYGGKAVISSYTEDSSSDNDATYGIDFVFNEFAEIV